MVRTCGEMRQQVGPGSLAARLLGGGVLGDLRDNAWPWRRPTAGSAAVDLAASGERNHPVWRDSDPGCRLAMRVHALARPPFWRRSHADMIRFSLLSEKNSIVNSAMTSCYRGEKNDTAGHFFMGLGFAIQWRVLFSRPFQEFYKKQKSFPTT